MTGVAYPHRQSSSESDDGEGDRVGPRDLLPPGADPAATARVGDGERDRIGASGGARATGAGAISVLTGHWESDGSNADALPKTDVGAACAETEEACAIGPASPTAWCGSAL